MAAIPAAERGPGGPGDLRKTLAKLRRMPTDVLAGVTSARNATDFKLAMFGDETPSGPAMGTNIPGKEITVQATAQPGPPAEIVSALPPSLARRPDAVRLAMFDPTDRTAVEPLLKHYLGRHLDIAVTLADPERRIQERYSRGLRYNSFHPDATALEVTAVLDRQEDARRERLNRHVLGVIQRDLGLKDIDEAAAVFERGRQASNDAVRQHANLVFPGNADAFLRDEITLPQRPADLLEWALRPVDDSNQKARALGFEVRRQFLETVIALQQEHSFNEAADQKLSQIQNLLSEKLYQGERGETTSIEMYGEFDNVTNELIYNNDDPRLEFGQPPSDAPKGKHFKALHIPVRQLLDDTYILTLINKKTPGSAIRKAMRKVFDRREENPFADDVVDVKEDVHDTHRMRLVVLETQADSENLADQVLTLLLDPENRKYFYDRAATGGVKRDGAGEPTGLPTGRGEIRFGARPGTGKSKNVHYTKIKVEFAGIQNPIEILVQTVANFATEQIETGEYNYETGMFSGAAHPVVEIQREFPLAEVHHPRTIYDRLLHPVSNGVRQPHPPLMNKVDALRRSREITIQEY